MNATDKKFREDLEGYEVKPSEAVWERIEEALPEREDEKAAVLWYRWAAAAAIVLMFTLGWMSREWTNEPAQGQFAAKPTEELEEAKSASTESGNDSVENREDSADSVENSAEGQGGFTAPRTDAESESRANAKAKANSLRRSEKLISLPRASVNLASLEYPAERQQVVDKRKKIKIDLEFTQPDHRQLMAQADPPKKSITEYAGEQWEALNSLKFGKLEDPRGKVALPKISKSKVEGALGKIFNRNKQAQ